jgi:hypothetical protein
MEIPLASARKSVSAIKVFMASLQFRTDIDLRLRALPRWRSSSGWRSGSRRDQRPRRGCAGSWSV